MSWVTIIWSMTAAACLTLAAISFLVWYKRRTAWADLLFTLTSTGTAVYAGCELAMAQAQSPAQFATALRWLQVPTWVIVVSLVGFVRLRLRAGRAWLGWSVFALRSLALLLDFVVGQNLNYREVTGLRHIRFLGESVSLGVGVSNPWMLVGQLSLLLLVIFTLDATVTVWRRGDGRQALLTGGSIVFFALTGMAQAVLVLWQIVDLPLTQSFFFLGIIVATGYELSHQTLRAAQLSDDLRESEARMTLAAEAAGVGVWMWTLATNRVWGSERWLALFGFAPDAPVPFEDIIQRIHPDDREGVERGVRHALEAGVDYRGEYRVVLSDNTQRWLAARGRFYPDAPGKPARMMGATLDITDRKQAEADALRRYEELTQELTHLSRVTTVSELSGSLAHELNQPLAIILTNAQAAQRLLAQHPPDLAEARDILADIVSEDERAGEIIRRLRSMLKHGESSLQPLIVNSIVEEVLQLSRNNLIGHGITVHRSLSGNLPKVLGDHIQLQQVLLNLILNACDAMSATPPAARHLALATAHRDGAVRIAVSDAGCGLPMDAERIFERFYTTKKHGLGLGLPICRSIVTAHNGRLWAKANIGADDTTTAINASRGTTFYLELPAATQEGCQ